MMHGHMNLKFDLLH